MVVGGVREWWWAVAVVCVYVCGRAESGGARVRAWLRSVGGGGKGRSVGGGVVFLRRPRRVGYRGRLMGREGANNSRMRIKTERSNVGWLTNLHDAFSVVFKDSSCHVA